MAKMTPEELAKAAGLEYKPGMSYEDFAAQAQAKGVMAQPSSAIPIYGPPPPGMTQADLVAASDKVDGPPPPPQTIKELAQAAQGAPTGIKKFKLEGYDAVAPPPTVAGGGHPQMESAPGIDLSKIKPIPGVTIAAHEGKAVSDRQSAQMMGAMDQESAAAQGLSEAQARTGAVSAQEQIGLAGLRQGLAMQAQAREAERQRTLDDHITQQQQMMDEVRTYKVDPDRVFSGVRGGFRALGSMIAMAMGGYLAGRNGGPNMAEAMIDKMVDRDVDAQKTELDKKRGQLSEMRSLYAQKLQQFGDQRAAEAATRSDLYAAAQAQAEATIADAKTDEQRKQGEMIVAQLAQKKAKEDMQLHPWVQAQTAGGVSVDQQLNMLAKAAGIEKTLAETSKARADAAGGNKSQKGLPPSVISQLGSIQSAKQAIQSEMALMDNANVPDAVKRRQSKQNLDMLSLELPKAFTGGVPTKEEIEMTREGLPPQQGGLTGATNAINPWGTSDETRRAQLQNQLKMLQHKEEALRQTANEARAVGSSAPEEQ